MPLIFAIVAPAVAVYMTLADRWDGGSIVAYGGLAAATFAGLVTEEVRRHRRRRRLANLRRTLRHG